MCLQTEHGAPAPALTPALAPALAPALVPALASALARALPPPPQGRLDETQCCFYASSLVLALEHLHTKGFIYRDLKPVAPAGKCASRLGGGPPQQPGLPRPSRRELGCLVPPGGGGTRSVIRGVGAAAGPRQRCPVSHRPENLLLDGHGFLKLADFPAGLKSTPGLLRDSAL